MAQIGNNRGQTQFEKLNSINEDVGRLKKKDVQLIENMAKSLSAAATYAKRSYNTRAVGGPSASSPPLSPPPVVEEKKGMLGNVTNKKEVEAYKAAYKDYQSDLRIQQLTRQLNETTSHNSEQMGDMNLKIDVEFETLLKTIKFDAKAMFYKGVNDDEDMQLKTVLTQFKEGQLDGKTLKAFAAPINEIFDNAIQKMENSLNELEKKLQECVDGAQTVGTLVDLAELLTDVDTIYNEAMQEIIDGIKDKTQTALSEIGITETDNYVMDQEGFSMDKSLKTLENHEAFKGKVASEVDEFFDDFSIEKEEGTPSLQLIRTLYDELNIAQIDMDFSEGLVGPNVDEFNYEIPAELKNKLIEISKTADEIIELENELATKDDDFEKESILNKLIGKLTISSDRERNILQALINKNGDFSDFDVTAKLSDHSKEFGDTPAGKLKTYSKMMSVNPIDKTSISVLYTMKKELTDLLMNFRNKLNSQSSSPAVKQYMNSLMDVIDGLQLGENGFELPKICLNDKGQLQVIPVQQAFTKDNFIDQLEDNLNAVGDNGAYEEVFNALRDNVDEDDASVDEDMLNALIDIESKLDDMENITSQAVTDSKLEMIQLHTPEFAENAFKQDLEILESLQLTERVTDIQTKMDYLTSVIGNKFVMEKMSMTPVVLEIGDQKIDLLCTKPPKFVEVLKDDRSSRSVEVVFNKESNTCTLKNDGEIGPDIDNIYAVIEDLTNEKIDPKNNSISKLAGLMSEVVAMDQGIPELESLYDALSQDHIDEQTFNALFVNEKEEVKSAIKEACDAIRTKRDDEKTVINDLKKLRKDVDSSTGLVELNKNLESLKNILAKENAVESPANKAEVTTLKERINESIITTCLTGLNLSITEITDLETLLASLESNGDPLFKPQTRETIVDKLVNKLFTSDTFSIKDCNSTHVRFSKLTKESKENLDEKLMEKLSEDSISAEQVLHLRMGNNTGDLGNSVLTKLFAEKDTVIFDQTIAKVDTLMQQKLIRSITDADNNTINDLDLSQIAQFLGNPSRIAYNAISHDLTLDGVLGKPDDEAVESDDGNYWERHIDDKSTAVSPRTALIAKRDELLTKKITELKEKLKISVKQGEEEEVKAAEDEEAEEVQKLMPFKKVALITNCFKEIEGQFKGCNDTNEKSNFYKALLVQLRDVATKAGLSNTIIDSTFIQLAKEPNIADIDSTEARDALMNESQPTMDDVRTRLGEICSTSFDELEFAEKRTNSIEEVLTDIKTAIIEKLSEKLSDLQDMKHPTPPQELQFDSVPKLTQLYELLMIVDDLDEYEDETKKELKSFIEIFINDINANIKEVAEIIEERKLESASDWIKNNQEIQIPEESDASTLHNQSKIYNSTIFEVYLKEANAAEITEGNIIAKKLEANDARTLSKVMSYELILYNLNKSNLKTDEKVKVILKLVAKEKNEQIKARLLDALIDNLSTVAKNIGALKLSQLAKVEHKDQMKRLVSYDNWLTGARKGDEYDVSWKRMMHLKDFFGIGAEHAMRELDAMSELFAEITGSLNGFSPEQKKPVFEWMLKIDAQNKAKEAADSVEEFGLNQWKTMTQKAEGKDQSDGSVRQLLALEGDIEKESILKEGLNVVFAKQIEAFKNKISNLDETVNDIKIGEKNPDNVQEFTKQEAKKRQEIEKFRTDMKAHFIAHRETLMEDLGIKNEQQFDVACNQFLAKQVDSIALKKNYLLEQAKYEAQFQLLEGENKVEMNKLIMDHKEILMKVDPDQLFEDLYNFENDLQSFKAKAYPLLETNAIVGGKEKFNANFKQLSTAVESSLKRNAMEKLRQVITAIETRNQAQLLYLSMDKDVRGTSKELVHRALGIYKPVAGRKYRIGTETVVHGHQNLEKKLNELLQIDSKELDTQSYLMRYADDTVVNYTVVSDNPVQMNVVSVFDTNHSKMSYYADDPDSGNYVLIGKLDTKNCQGKDIAVDVSRLFDPTLSEDAEKHVHNIQQFLDGNGDQVERSTISGEATPVMVQLIRNTSELKLSTKKNTYPVNWRKNKGKLEALKAKLTQKTQDDLLINTDFSDNCDTYIDSCDERWMQELEKSNDLGKVNQLLETYQKNDEEIKSLFSANKTLDDEEFIEFVCKLYEDPYNKGSYRYEKGKAYDKEELTGILKQQIDDGEKDLIEQEFLDKCHEGEKLVESTGKSNGRLSCHVGLENEATFSVNSQAIHDHIQFKIASKEPYYKVGDRNYQVGDKIKRDGTEYVIDNIEFRDVLRPDQLNENDLVEIKDDKDRVTHYTCVKDLEGKIELDPLSDDEETIESDDLAQTISSSTAKKVTFEITNINDPSSHTTLSEKLEGVEHFPANPVEVDALYFDLEPHLNSEDRMLEVSSSKPRSFYKGTKTAKVADGQTHMSVMPGRQSVTAGNRTAEVTSNLLRGTQMPTLELSKMKVGHFVQLRGKDGDYSIENVDNPAGIVVTDGDGKKFVHQVSDIKNYSSRQMRVVAENSTMLPVQEGDNEDGDDGSGSLSKSSDGSYGLEEKSVTPPPPPTERDETPGSTHDLPDAGGDDNSEASNTSSLSDGSEDVVAPPK